VSLVAERLNRIIGEDKTLSIKVGGEASDPSGEDVIVLRGASGDVDRAVKEILTIVENAKNDEIVNSFVSALPSSTDPSLIAFRSRNSISSGSLSAASSALKARA
jgi:hypothetical protein